MEVKDWNGSLIEAGRWVLYTQQEIIRTGVVIGFKGTRVLVEWKNSKTSLPDRKIGEVMPWNLTVMGQHEH